jgi:hypothetical protein
VDGSHRVAGLWAVAVAALANWAVDTRDVPLVMAYVEPAAVVEDATALVAREVCVPLARGGVPTPIAYRLVWARGLGRGTWTPDVERRVDGVVWCPADHPPQ